MVLRHVPERTCVACRLQQPKRSMVRIVRSPSGSVGVDPTGKASGRGAYLCHEPACWANGLKKQVLARALKTTITEVDRAALEAYADSLANGAEELAPLGVALRSTT